MARQHYETLLNNSNVRTMLNLIAQAEGVKWGYNTMFGNQKIDSLASHPNIRKQFKQTDGKTNFTTAAGRYQFLKSTWDGLASQLGLRDFSPRSQDLGAIALLAQNGALPYVLKGDYQNAVRKSGGTWASLPSSNYAQPKKDWNFVNKQLGVIERPQRNPIMGNWSEFTKSSRSNERTPMLGNWSSFTSQNQKNTQAPERSPIIGNWSEFTRLKEG